MKASIEATSAKAALTLGSAILFYGGVAEFYNISWGTGNWRGEFSQRWGVAFALFVFVCTGLLALILVRLWRGEPPAFRLPGNRIPAWVHWLLGAAAIVAPIWLLQYSSWGIVLRGPYLRLLIWAASVTAIAGIIASASDRPLGIRNLLPAILLSGAGFGIAAAFTDVTDYPFSLGWSEGNRLWDYSLLFGRRLYTYESAEAPVAYLDFGRQLLGGLPFLLPRVSIFGERLWLAAISVFPYLVLAVLVFMPVAPGGGWQWILAGIFGFSFLAQGPIHPPLVVSAILVAVAWRSPLRFAIPLLLISGWFAATSRFTWLFAPAIWSVLLETVGTPADDGSKTISRRAIILGMAGLVGAVAAFLGVFEPRVASIGSNSAVSSQQALLWYRLLPNATYGEGILIGLLRAAGPLLAILGYVVLHVWRPRPLQRWIMGLALAAFLVVGLIISTKIGGGGDLHNLDMFLIGLLFTAGVVWKGVGQENWIAPSGFPPWARIAVVVMLALPAYQPLMALRPLQFQQDAAWLSVLADVERARDLGSLPSDETALESLQQLRNEVQQAKSTGDVLFMDQRQLLTFGQVSDVRLISSYEKKRMMDEALSGNAAYFRRFYEDLDAQRYRLIVSSLLRTPIKDSEYGFGEENNAWVIWIARPVLCYYEEKDTLTEVKVELLVPRVGHPDCSAALPRP